MPTRLRWRRRARSPSRTPSTPNSPSSTAKETLVAADALDARKDYPVSVFISSKTGRLVAKLGFVQVMDVPVTIAEAGRPLGTHVLTATHFTEGEKALRWNAVTFKHFRSGAVLAPQEASSRGRDVVQPAGHDADAATALERIEIPKETPSSWPN